MTTFTVASFDPPTDSFFKCVAAHLHLSRTHAARLALRRSLLLELASNLFGAHVTRITQIVYPDTRPVHFDADASGHAAARALMVYLHDTDESVLVARCCDFLMTHWDAGEMRHPAVFALLVGRRYKITVCLDDTEAPRADWMCIRRGVEPGQGYTLYVPRTIATPRTASIVTARLGSRQVPTYRLVGGRSYTKSSPLSVYAPHTPGNVVHRGRLVPGATASGGVIMTLTRTTVGVGRGGMWTYIWSGGFDRQRVTCISAFAPRCRSARFYIDDAAHDDALFVVKATSMNAAMHLIRTEHGSFFG